MQKLLVELHVCGAQPPQWRRRCPSPRHVLNALPVVQVEEVHRDLTLYRRYSVDAYLAVGHRLALEAVSLL
jgi:hypothetical protein